MALKQWVDNGWIKPHKTSQKEINNLMVMVERDIVAAKT